MPAMEESAGWTLTLADHVGAAALLTPADFDSSTGLISCVNLFVHHHQFMLIFSLLVKW